MGAKQQAIKDMSEEGIHTTVLYMEKAILPFTINSDQSEISEDIYKEEFISEP